MRTRTAAAVMAVIVALLGAASAQQQQCITAVSGDNCTGGFGSLCSNLTWVAPVGDPVTGYNVYRGLTPGGEDMGQPINSTAVGTTAYQDNAIPSGATTLYYKVAGVYAGGLTGPASNEACVTFPKTAPPTSLVAVPQVGK